MTTNNIYLAHKTKEAIDNCIKADQGATYRKWLGRVLPHIGDAYSEDSFPFRSHMGASLIGNECGRAVWYGFRWSMRPVFEGRLIRLFNRGHLEEGRFIAQLLSIGVEVFQQDENGKQFRISHAGGHFGGSGDGIAIGLPDLAPGQACLLEFKTHNDKSFKKLVEVGVKEAKWEHYVQMNVYMRKMGLPIALYGAVNKNDDSEHWELVPLNPEIADAFLDRGERLVQRQDAPKKLNASPGFFKCKFCNFRPICHLGVQPDRNCRTCQYAKIADGGVWKCGKTNSQLTKEQQLAGCNQYYLSDGFINK